MPKKKQSARVPGRGPSGTENRSRGSSHYGESLATAYDSDDMAAATAKAELQKKTFGKANISMISVEYNIPYVTLWKRVTGCVLGTGVLAGGGRKPRVMTIGELFSVFFFSVKFIDSRIIRSTSATRQA
jgi:hypothetical protein